MSVFGGDSWGREAQYRKRRIDDLTLDGLPHNDYNSNPKSNSSYKMLRSGKYVCLVCPHNPILDTPLILCMHVKAPRHCAAEARLKERELERQNEMDKRIALSHTRISPGNTQQCRSATKLLIESTRKAAREVLYNSSPQQGTAYETKDAKTSPFHTTNGPYASASAGTLNEIEVAVKDVFQQPIDYRERRERELKFTAAGWKRNGHGGWFRDENVEFDSDEEDPNASLSC